MPKTYYELLDVPVSAPADEIKRAFRREIAKYHPDKVQHLGQEFQEIAAIKAAELTQAYKTLSDPVLRAEYDAEIGEVAPAAAAVPAAPQAAPQEPAVEQPRPRPEPVAPPASAGGGTFSQERAGASELINRAAIMRFRQSLQGEFRAFEEVPLGGFEVACLPKPAFFSLKLPPRVLGRFVSHVDAPTLVETWALASKMKKDSQRDIVVFLMGPVVAPAGELAGAIAGQRRKPMPAGGKLFMVPVNTRNWNAHVPADAPPVVKSLVTRLKTA